MKKHLLLIMTLLLIFACNKKKEHEHGFYYWRSAFNISPKESQLLQDSKVPVLYTRFFDITKNGHQYEAVGTIYRNNKDRVTKKIVPVIFITNETWYKISKEDITALAKKTDAQIKHLAKTNFFDLADEIQIDSDWTKTTKDDYFQFLKELEQLSNKSVSSTLRLHQVRDRKVMGIPPVKKLYLMCYSTSSPLDKSDRNSILDLKLLKSYLSDLDQYPLPVDIALPIYSWAIVTNHLGKHKLINAVKQSDLENSNFEKISESTYRVLNDDFYFGMYLNKGFTIKVEEVSEGTLLESISFIDSKLKKPYSIIYYHLDEQFTQHYKNILK